MEMKKKVLLTGAALASLSPMALKEAAAATAAVDIQAVVLRAINLTQVTSLNFGAFSQTGGATTVIVPAGGGVPTYGAGLFAAGAPAATDAIVTIKASKGFNIDLSVTNGSVAISNGTATMKVNTFKIDEGANLAAFASAQTVVAKLTAANTGNFEVGATLQVGATQAAGTYTGTFTVQAVYQ